MRMVIIMRMDSKDMEVRMIIIMRIDKSTDDEDEVIFNVSFVP